MVKSHRDWYNQIKVSWLAEERKKKKLKLLIEIPINGEKNQKTVERN